jgi:hypothetical protein
LVSEDRSVKELGAPEVYKTGEVRSEAFKKPFE